MDMVISIPVAIIPSIIALAQSLIFAAILLAPRFQSRRGCRFLIAALVILASVQADTIYQELGGLYAHPQWGFVLAPYQALLTPVLYLFIVARTRSDFKLERGHLLHLAPFVLFTVYLFFLWYRHDTAGKLLILSESVLAAPFNRLFVPLLGDAIQLSYVAAAIQRLKSHGVLLRDWFSRIEGKDKRWLKHVMTLWGAVFVLHTTATMAFGAFGSQAIAFPVFAILMLVQLAMVNALFLIGVLDEDTIPQSFEKSPKYAGSALSEEDRTSLYKRIVRLMESQKPYLSPDLTLRDLAESASASPRELSQALNGVGGVSFFEFVNRERVLYAQQLLISDPDIRILDAALNSGFNSKSSFNDAFRKISGETPSGYRRRMLNAHNARPVEKSP